MWKIVAVLALAGLAIVTGQIADTQTAFQFADGATPLMYAGVRG